MAGHKGVPMLYGRGRAKAVRKQSGQCSAGRCKNCFSLNCTCSCHSGEVERDDAKAASKATASA